MLSYTIAIRTLGKSGEVFRKELEQIALQTVQPDKVLIYIAKGYARPDFQIGKEEYVWVEKGMVSQRLRTYDEINSDCILMLDDDVVLQPDSVEKLLKTMEKKDTDCIGVDTFCTHNLPFSQKIYAAITNLVFPHWSDKWAFKIHHNGSFSYNNYPVKNFYWSQSCAGNAILWKKGVYEQLHLEDELWLDDFPFAYNDDMLESYKVYKNGFKLGIVYNSGIVHLDMKSASKDFRESPDWIKTQTKSQFIIWWRTCFKSGNISLLAQTYACLCFIFKTIWLFFVMLGISIMKNNTYYLKSYLSGLKGGYTFVQSDKFRALRPYAFMR